MREAAATVAVYLISMGPRGVYCVIIRGFQRILLLALGASTRPKNQRVTREVVFGAPNASPLSDKSNGYLKPKCLLGFMV